MTATKGVTARSAPENGHAPTISRSERLPVASLRVAEYNPRFITDERFKNLCESIAQDPDFMDVRPLIVNQYPGREGVVVGGNMRLRAVQALGWTDVPCVLVSVPLPVEQQWNLKDNGQWGSNSEDELAELIYHLQEAGDDITHLGFDQKEIDKLLASVGVGSTEEDEGDFTPPANPVTKLGDLWLMGEHRLLCGNATNTDDVRRLMNGQRAVLFATDPPYLVDYDGTNHPHKWEDQKRVNAGLQKDKNKDWSESYHDGDWDDPTKQSALYDGYIAAAIEVAIDEHAAWYCWHAGVRSSFAQMAWERHGAFVHQQIIWVKDRPILTRSHYMWQHEPCFYGWIRGNRPKRLASDYPTSVWNIPTVPAGEHTEHPTAKPVELFAIPMRQHTKPGDICYEPFCGSGSQIIAGEQLGRRVFALELEPGYVDVAVRRWEKLTGQQAIRE